MTWSATDGAIATMMPDEDRDGRHQDRRRGQRRWPPVLAQEPGGRPQHGGDQQAQHDRQQDRPQLAQHPEEDDDGRGDEQELRGRDGQGAGRALHLGPAALGAVPGPSVASAPGSADGRRPEPADPPGASAAERRPVSPRERPGRRSLMATISAQPAAPDRRKRSSSYRGS